VIAALAAISTLLALSGASLAAGSGTTPVDLANLGTDTTIRAVSSTGQFVGSMSVGGTTHAFSLTSADGLVDLGVLPGATASWATAVNDNGEVAGVSAMPSGQVYGFVWTKTGGLTDIGTLPGGLTPNAISDTGQVVGSYGVGYPNAFSWTPATGLIDIGTLGGPYADARDVNDHGEVVGWADTRPGETHAFVWTSDSGMVDLGTLGGPGTFGGPWSDAAAINDAGQVAGSSRTASGIGDAFSWTQAGGMVDIAPYASATAVSGTGQVIGSAGDGAFSWTAQDGLQTVGGRDTRPTAVSDTGVVVGMTPSDDGWDAFAWTRDDGMVTLGNLLGGTFGSAMAADSHGHIYGYGWIPGEQHALVWSFGDTTSPVIQVPAPITANATAPSGATVAYSVSANDPDDSVSSLTCTPASGSTFAIGDTTVNCTATDSSGNTATASFVVHVRGAAEQLANLSTNLDSYNLGKLGTSLHDKLVTVQRFLAANKPQQACASLADFYSEVQSQSGKGLSVSQAFDLAGSASRIMNVIGC
jgi:probable HAF family extracellular repeat protein